MAIRYPLPRASQWVSVLRTPSTATQSVGHVEVEAAHGTGTVIAQTAGCDACTTKVEDANGGDCKECKEDSCSWCDLGDKIDFSELLLGKECKLDFGGWVTLGYNNITTGAPGNPGVMFNNRPDRFNLHQAVLYAEKTVDGSEGIDFGYRASILYGIDAIDTQAFGNRPGTWDYLNGWGSGDSEGTALPQLYLEMAVNEKLSFKGGRFYTLIGYETVSAPNNFFFSHAFTFFFSEPFTHTGLLGTYKASDNLKFTGGWVAGNDTGFQINMGGSAFLGIATWTVSEALTLSYALNVGDLGFSGSGFHQTLLANWKFADKWEYVFQNDVADTEIIRSQGINNYLYYTVNDCVKLGCRAEWYHVFEESFYEVTFGVNVTPHANVRFRPEIRYQWSPDGKGAKNPIGVQFDQGAIFGIDAVILF